LRSNAPRTIAVLTLFPGVVEAFVSESIPKRAAEKGIVCYEIHDLRRWGLGVRRQVDDRPYGGGAGMVIRADVLVPAVEEITKSGDWHVVLLTPAGRVFNQKIAHELAQKERLLLVCGHYEGIDERAVMLLRPDEISVGDYVTSGGEAPALLIIDTVVRLYPGVLGNEASLGEESFSHGLLEYPQFTRPAVYRGIAVPDVLLSGNHKEVERWRKKQSEHRTRHRRPDLWRRYLKSKKEEKR